ncbi:unnamed protein product [Gongylonema pulchrum]|uniref:Crossover junction endonuclease MUS81 n=1 Tax=Gongylonema pulchrum TaxID=637853 RepID=A0A183D4S0_9BILA|nr:unnamed protein product [Gongylonema pulchrum]
MAVLQKKIELQKQMARFEREVITAKKSKCEQNLFCFISPDLLGSIGNLGEMTMKVFEKRNIGGQLHLGGQGPGVCWKRRILEGEVENGEFIRGERMIYEQCCILPMNAGDYSAFKRAEELSGFVEQCLQKYPFVAPRATLVVYGILQMPKGKMADFVLEIFERYRAQTRFIVTVEEYAALIARMHRSIARNERRLEEQNQLIVNIEKGISEGDNSCIVSDWWMKMLSQMHRMGSDAQRTIATIFPDPHSLLKL